MLTSAKMTLIEEADPIGSLILEKHCSATDWSVIN